MRRRSRSASARRSRSSRRISCAATRAASPARCRPPGRRARSRALPSIKANYTLALRCALTQEGLGCDVFGPAELHAALAGGVPPQLISVNGTGKTRALLEQAVTHRRARDARQRARDRPRARRGARPRPARRRCASGCGRATSSCSSARTSRGLRLRDRAGVQARHPDRGADRGGPRGGRGARARRPRPDVASRPAPQRSRDLARLRRQRRRDRGRARGCLGRLAARRARPRRRLRGAARPQHLGARRRHRPAAGAGRRGRRRGAREPACARASPVACRWPA